MIQKYRIGKNKNGWYLLTPSFGTFDVLEGIESFEDAVRLFDMHRHPW